MYLAAAVLGGVLGAKELLPFDAIPTKSTALARVGYALRDADPKASEEDWAALRRDVESVRAAWKAEEPAFDLVVAVRGLNQGGNSEWTRAQALCRELKWPHCDQRALDEMKRRSRP